MLDNRTLLQVNDLRVDLPTVEGQLHAVRGVDLQLKAGEALGIVGESGSGKSMTALALMRLLPMHAKLNAQVLAFGGADLLATTDRTFARDISGQQMAMIFQEPMTSLNPVYTVGRQLTEMSVRTGKVTPTEARERAIYLLDRVGIPAPESRLGQYPHQLSGGQRQRVMIAMALMNEPELIIADEPTTALDVTVQAQILELLSDLRHEFGMGLILITHDLAVVANTVDRVLVMYGGEAVEQGPCRAVLHHPLHPYTQGLLDCVPKTGLPQERLGAIPGMMPTLLGEVKGCAFAPRCKLATDSCRQASPPVHAVDAERSYRCVIEPAALQPANAIAATGGGTARRDGGEVILAASGVHRIFQVKRGLFGKPRPLHALNDVTIDLRRGETLALVGESGSGKTTLAKILLGLDAPNAGDILLDGEPVTTMDPKRRARLVQPIFQDPYSSLNPRRTLGEIIGRPLVVHGIGEKKDRRRRVEETMALVGLPRRLYHNYPNQLSGGQRQRVAVARALIMQPEVVICDEPTSALDVSVQAQILNMLADLQRDLGLTYVLITHDIGVVDHIATRVAVMYMGQIVEVGTADDVLRRPQHPYTKLLLSSVPSFTADATEALALDRGVVTNPLDPPPGCRFAPRCPLAQEACSTAIPALRAVAGRQIRCILETKDHPDAR